jgi:hypothetical protein
MTSTTREATPSVPEDTRAVTDAPALAASASRRWPARPAAPRDAAGARPMAKLVARARGAAPVALLAGMSFILVWFKGPEAGAAFTHALYAITGLVNRRRAPRSCLTDDGL